VIGLALVSVPRERLVAGAAVQGSRARLVQRVGAGPQRGAVVHPEHEFDPLGPPVEVCGQREVGVPAQTHPLRVRPSNTLAAPFTLLAPGLLDAGVSRLRRSITGCQSHPLILGRLTSPRGLLHLLAAVNQRRLMRDLQKAARIPTAKTSHRRLASYPQRSDHRLPIQRFQL
jgi:hypothetical protein